MICLAYVIIRQIKEVLELPLLLYQMITKKNLNPFKAILHLNLKCQVLLDLQKLFCQVLIHHSISTSFQRELNVLHNNLIYRLKTNNIFGESINGITLNITYN